MHESKSAETVPHGAHKLRPAHKLACMCGLAERERRRGRRFGGEGEEERERGGVWGQVRTRPASLMQVLHANSVNKFCRD